MENMCREMLEKKKVQKKKREQEKALKMHRENIERIEKEKALKLVENNKTLSKERRAKAQA